MPESDQSLQLRGDLPGELVPGKSDDDVFDWTDWHVGILTLSVLRQGYEISATYASPTWVIVPIRLDPHA